MPTGLQIPKGPCPGSTQGGASKIQRTQQAGIGEHNRIGEVTADKITQYLGKKGAVKSWEDRQSHAGLTDALPSKLIKSYPL